MRWQNAKRDFKTVSRVDIWRKLYDYWRSLPAVKSQLDCDPPAELPEFASNMMIVELTGAAIRYVYFGSEIATKIGLDLTGKAIGGSNLIEQVKLGWQQLLRSVARLRTPRLVLISGEGETANYVLALPLIDDEKRVRRILVGVFFDDLAGTKIIIRRWKKLELPED